MALKMSWERQKDVFAIAASNDNHALAELRCAVIHGVQDAVHSLVAKTTKLIQHYVQDCGTPINRSAEFGRRKSFDVFH